MATSDDPTVECEQCGDRVERHEAETKAVSGDTVLAFCRACTRPPRHVEYGVRP